MAENSLSAFLSDLKKAVDTKEAAQSIVATLKEVITIFDKLKKDAEQERKDFSETAQLIAADLRIQLEEYKRSATAQLALKLAEINQRMSEIKNGDPGKDADPIEIVNQVMALIKLPEYRAPVMDGPEEIATKLDLLDDDNQLAVIKALQKRIDDLEKTQKKQFAGTMAPSIGHWPLHETFTMNGSDTSVTLSQGVGAQGTAILARYQGQTLDLTSQFTVNGNQVSFVDFVPANETIISITYWP